MQRASSALSYFRSKACLLSDCVLRATKQINHKARSVEEMARDSARVSVTLSGISAREGETKAKV